ncbi:MAG: hypothetical protein Q9217_000245 [Psora testacea]
MSIGDLVTRDNSFQDNTAQQSNIEDDVSDVSVDPPAPNPLSAVKETVDPVLGRKITLGDGSKPLSTFSQRIFRATFNDSGNGYNISLPAWLCADLIIGDWESPNGTGIVNGSIGDLYSQLLIPSKALSNYTYTRAAALAASINETFANILCEPIPNTGRALTYDGWRTQDIEGFWEAYIIATGGIMGIGILGLHLGIIHEGITANISLQTQVYILAATGTLQFMCATTMFRLQTNGFLPRTEAMLLNALWTLGEKIRDMLIPCWASTCASWSTFTEGVNALAAQALNSVRVINPDQMRHGQPSSLDLISQVRDLETGHGSGGGAAPGVGGHCATS